jgi:hypothetical protein
MFECRLCAAPARRALLCSSRGKNCACRDVKNTRRAGLHASTAEQSRTRLGNSCPRDLVLSAVQLALMDLLMARTRKYSGLTPCLLIFAERESVYVSHGRSQLAVDSRAAVQLNDARHTLGC